MKASNFNNAALFMALALTAAPALAGTSHGGSPLVSTNEHALLKVGESPNGEKDKTVEAPLAADVNIQPSVRAGDTVKADGSANAKLLNTNHTEDMKSETSTAAKTVIDPDAPPAVKK